MRYFIFILAILLISSSTFAIKIENINDSVHLECHYKYIMFRDTLTTDNIYRDSMILRIGKKYTSFFSYYRLQEDSIEASPDCKELRLKLFHTRIHNLDSIRKAGIATTYEYLYKDLNMDSCYIYGKIGAPGMKKNVVVIEKIPQIKWTISDSLKTICGYDCIKATTTFRGRIYVAWFTKDLPWKEGPWKLCGLPGLILKAYDSKKHYYFMAERIILSPKSQIKEYNWDDKEPQLIDRLLYLRNLYEDESRFPIVYQGTEHGFDLLETDYKN